MWRLHRVLHVLYLSFFSIFGYLYFYAAGVGRNLTKIGGGGDIRRKIRKFYLLVVVLFPFSLARRGSEFWVLCKLRSESASVNTKTAFAETWPFYRPFHLQSRLPELPSLRALHTFVRVLNDQSEFEPLTAWLRSKLSPVLCVCLANYFMFTLAWHAPCYLNVGHLVIVMLTYVHLYAVTSMEAANVTWR